METRVLSIGHLVNNPWRAGILRIDDQNSKDRLLKAVSERQMRDLLVRMLKEGKSASDLSDETRIPLSSVYRHIHELNEAGLLAVDRATITEQGKRLEFYRSTVTEVNLKFEIQSDLLDLRPNEDIENKFYRLWSSIREVRP